MLKVPHNAVSVIKKSLEASFKNKATFPEHVKTVASVGVTSYAVDLVKSKVIYYLADGQTHTETLPSTLSQPNIHFFAKTEVKKAITEIQKQAIDYPTFLNRIASAGTKGYEVDINEGKVTYRGENDKHIEEFPKSTI